MRARALPAWFLSAFSVVACTSDPTPIDPARDAGTDAPVVADAGPDALVCPGSDACPACQNGVDDDGDALVDYPLDPDCARRQDDDEGAPPPPAACANGEDDDDDGASDYPEDPGCADEEDDDETDPPPPACANGVDDDGDGALDFPDDAECESAADGDERCLVLGEGFDGTWPGAFTTEVGAPMVSRRAASAHDGPFGIRDPMWVTYLPGVSFGEVGEVVSVWTRTTNDPRGTIAGLHFGIEGGPSPRSYACAVNLAEELVIWAMSSTGITPLASTAAVRERDRWYHLEVEVTATDTVACRIVADGATAPLATVTHTFGAPITGPVGVRGMPLADFDTLEVCR